MTIDSLLRPKTLLFALCLGASATACNVDNGDDDDDGGGDDDVVIDADDDDGDKDDLVSCQADCADDDDACLDLCEEKYVYRCDDQC